MTAPLLKRALDLATTWHHGQRRKYPGIAVPYASHLAGVAVILARHGFSEAVVAAGALHDTLEDTEATYDDLVLHFGPHIAQLVQHCSEQDKSLPWEVRKAHYLAAFVDKPWEAQAITLADKIDNLQSLVVCATYHGNPWAELKRGRTPQLERFTALLRAAQTLAPHPLIGEYSAALTAAAAVAEDGTIAASRA